MRIITIRGYEMKCRSRWGWHTFRDGKDYKGKIIGFRFLGIGLCWRAPNAEVSHTAGRKPETEGMK